LKNRELILLVIVLNVSGANNNTFIINMEKDIKLYIEWLALREYTVRNEKTKKERELHLYFKLKYDIRLFETSYNEVLNKIEGKQ
jgi:hypothetical protein